MRCCLTRLCAADLCDPTTPLRYHIDPSIPEKWRPYFKKGVESWQPAFAALGFKNTPSALLPGDPGWPVDYTAGDMRYPSISFSISRDHVFSVGPSVVDPRSGEILDADIGFAQVFVCWCWWCCCDVMLCLAYAFLFVSVKA